MTRVGSSRFVYETSRLARYSTSACAIDWLLTTWTAAGRDSSRRNASPIRVALASKESGIKRNQLQPLKGRCMQLQNN